MKLNKNNVLAYHTALEFYGLGHSEFFSSFVMNPANLPPIEKLPEMTIYFVKPTINKYNIITINNQEFKVTSLEATFLDCLLHLKYCGGFEEFYRSLQGLDGTNELKFNKNKTQTNKEKIELNLNYLYELLKEYNIQKLYNLTGFILESLKKHWQIEVSEKFLQKLKKHISSRTITLEKSYSNQYYIDKTWNIKIPKEFKSIIEGFY